MRKATLTLALVCAGFVGCIETKDASAQAMPNWGAAMNQMAMQNMAFDNMMQQHAANTAWQVFHGLQDYRARTGYTGPIQVANPYDLQRSIQGMHDAFDSYNDAWERNSQIQDEAVARWTRQAIRGNQMYGDPNSGAMYELPYDYDVYNEYAGDILPGYVPGGNNYYPVYPTW